MVEHSGARANLRQHLGKLADEVAACICGGPLGVVVYVIDELSQYLHIVDVVPPLGGELRDEVWQRSRSKPVAAGEIALCIADRRVVVVPDLRKSLQGYDVTGDIRCRRAAVINGR